MILLWGLSGDGPFDAVHDALRERDAPLAFVDQRDILETSLELSFDGDLEGSLCVGDDCFDLADVTAVYWRTYDLRRLPAITRIDDTGDARATAIQAAWLVEEAILAWMECTAARVLNRASAMASGNSKPFQAQVIRRHGFETPRTLVTTNVSEALRFWTEHSSVIYKSISGTRSVVSRLRLSDVSRLENIVWCPTQFQQHVPGRDYRVHVVGEKVFACEVISDADDYRYATQQAATTDLSATELPDEIAHRCVELADSLGLTLAGIDLRRAPDDRWYCFEVNPSPGFTYYEAATKQPIAAAIADHLLDACTQ